MVNFDVTDPCSAEVRTAVGAAITDFLASRQPLLEAIDPQLDVVARLAQSFTAGGKRLRPAFCLWGYIAASGFPDDPAPLIRVAASLDMLHVGILMHDDVIDASDTRRGLRAVHRQLQNLHHDRGWRGDAGQFGNAGAIVTGDLLLMWSAQLLDECGLRPEVLAKALPWLHAMRAEVMCGQYLDIVAAAHDPHDTRMADVQQQIWQVVEYKTARYTVQRPLQIGAALGDASDQLMDALMSFGSPLGRAFQLRDDLLGIFSDAAVTGKPAGDDIRDGKMTLLVALALSGASSRDRAELAGMLGDPHLGESGVAKARDIITASGAREAVEDIITNDYRTAITVLAQAPMTDAGRAGLTALADLAVHRSL